MWEGLLEEYRGVPWVGAHMGGNPEDLHRLQGLLDRFPDLWLDCSATRWMVREVSARRDAAREFFVRNQDRIIFGSTRSAATTAGSTSSPAASGPTASCGRPPTPAPAPIFDPDLPPDRQPTLRGLALPDAVLQKMYHDNATRFMANIGITFGGWG
jgi:hypothetical protein